MIHGHGWSLLHMDLRMDRHILKKFWMLSQRIFYTFQTSKQNKKFPLYFALIEFQEPRSLKCSLYLISAIPTILYFKEKTSLPSPLSSDSYCSRLRVQKNFWNFIFCSWMNPTLTWDMPPKSILYFKVKNVSVFTTIIWHTLLKAKTSDKIWDPIMCSWMNPTFTWDMPSKFLLKMIHRITYYCKHILKLSRSNNFLLKSFSR